MSLPVQPSPTILLPHLPPKTLVGIDLITFTSTANFHGIRDLPSGWHFLYTGTTESLSLRSGAWFYIGDISGAQNGHKDSAVVRHQPQTQNSPEIFVWKWSTDTESLASLRGDVPAESQESMRYKANLGAIWQTGGLFRYRSRVPKTVANGEASQDGQGQDVVQVEDDDETEESGRSDWRRLTDRISPGVLNRIVGHANYDADGHPRWMVTSASTADRDADHIPGLDPQRVKDDGVPETTGEQEREFGFLPIDLKHTWREGAIGRERSEAAQDRSWALGDLIQRVSQSGDSASEGAIDEELGTAEVLGELQFTFLMVLTMMNYSCLQQWKRVLELVLTSRAAIVQREAFMSEFLALLLRQLQRCDDVEGGLFEMDGDDGGAFLRELLKKFRRFVYQVIEDSAKSSVKDELSRLEAWLKEEYDWELTHEAIVKRGMVRLEDGEEVEIDMDDNDEDEETGEYAPMIVDSEEATL